MQDYTEPPRPKKLKVSELYELYFKCHCKQYGIKRLITKADYVFNIENLNCKMLKALPDNYINNGIRKQELKDRFYEKFGEHYKDNLTPCTRKIVLEQYPQLTVNTDY